MEEVSLARAVMRLAEEGSLPVVARALSASPALPRWTASPTPGAPAVPAPAAAHEPQLAARLLARHPPATRTALLAAIRAAPPGASAARWLARLALLDAAPESAAQPDLLAAMTEAVILEAASATNAPTGIAERRLQAAPATPRGPPPVAEAWTATPIGAEATRAEAVPPRAAPMRATAANDDPATPSRIAPPAEAVALLPVAEHRSRGAGVLLLVRPLARMGLGGWLGRHPDLAASGFARALLRHVAQRMRMPPEDVLFTMLGEDDAAPPAPLDAWRIGLDRWLRRRVRRRLADVAQRPGWLCRSEDSLVVRFAADAADLRLRRLALDVDPGWVPWLGCAVRYHFRDAPQ
jgi:hypothetical protein